MTNEALALLLAMFGGLFVGVVTASAIWRLKLREVEADNFDLEDQWFDAIATIRELEAQIAPFDRDGDGRIGGSLPRQH